MFHVCYSRELRLVVAPATTPTVLYRIVLILLSLSLDATPLANAIYDKSKYVKSSIDSVPCSLSSASELKRVLAMSQLSILSPSLVMNMVLK